MLTKFTLQLESGGVATARLKPAFALLVCAFLGACSVSRPPASDSGQASPQSAPATRAPAPSPPAAATGDGLTLRSTEGIRRQDAPSSQRDVLVFSALGHLGVRYRYGGNTPATGFDCSGLVSHVFREVTGIRLPRSAAEISQHGTSIQRSELLPGDLVFFNTLRRPFSHVGIYLGDNRFVHAPSSGGQVRIENMTERYWVGRYNGSRRLLPA